MIRTADFVTMDGMGLMLALWLLGRGRRPRIIGSSVLRSMCGLAERTDAAVAFLLRDDGLATPPLLRGALRNHWPKLNAAIGTISAPSAPDEALIRAVNDHAPAMLVMNIGGPAQEEWITSYVDLFPSVRIVVGVGGAIDYLAGSVPTPPALVRRLGFEWAWRLVRQPRRFRRIFNATIIFPFFVLTDALNAPARRIFLRFRSA